MSVPGTPNPEDLIGAKPPGAITPGEPRTPTPTGQPFQSYMQGAGQQNPLLAAGKNPQVSPFDLAHGRVPAPGPNFNTVQNQTVMAQSAFGDIANQLNTPNLKLKQSTKYLLKNKLASAKSHIRSASNKLGAKEAEEQAVPAGANPIKRYLSLVTDGQNQLEQTQQQLEQLSAKGEQMKPADMMLIQIKLSKAQQELEYSSLILSKAVDDLKMMMNIQL